MTDNLNRSTRPKKLIISLKLRTTCFLNFFPTYKVYKKIGIDTHPIDLSCHQKLKKKIHRPVAEIVAHEVRNMEKVMVD